MRKIGLLSIALIIALGFGGVGYASWNDTLQAKGTVEVEDCWVEYCKVESNDSGETIDPDYDKHVASTEVEINQGYKHCHCWSFSRPNTITVTVTNAYPSYHPTVDFWVKAYAYYHCAQLCGIKINGTEVAAGETVPLYGGDLLVTVNPPETIPPCNCGQCQCTQGNMNIHVEQSAQQCHTYTFTVTMYYRFTCCQ
jgi:hypothetical protein